MMGKQPANAGRLFYYDISLERRVPPRHLLRQIKQGIDFAFAYEEVKDCYGVKGNVSVPPPVTLAKKPLLYSSVGAHHSAWPDVVRAKGVSQAAHAGVGVGPLGRIVEASPIMSSPHAPIDRVIETAGRVNIVSRRGRRRTSAWASSTQGAGRHGVGSQTRYVAFGVPACPYERGIGGISLDAEHGAIYYEY